MKAKRKIDQQAIQQFLIEHTEKIVIGLVGLLFLYFVYQAIMLPQYRSTPDNLKGAISAAQAKMAQGPINAKVPEIPEFIKQVIAFKNPIVLHEDVAFEVLPNILAPRKLRDAPTIYPVEKLAAVVGRGALASGNAGRSATGSVGQRWVLVTGLVPWRREIAEYHDKFADAADASHLEPEYCGFLVQRGEMPASGTGEPKWEEPSTISVNAFVELSSKFPTPAHELVDAQCVDATLTSPLPRLARGQWGDEVAHVPEITLLPPEPKEKAGGLADDPDRRLRGLQIGGRMDGGDPRSGQGPPPAIGFGDGRPELGMGPGFGPTNVGPRPGVDRDNLLGGMGPGKPAVQQAAEQPPEYKLLRYFDFDVKPGKCYAYRFFVVLKNPNFGLPANVLIEAELANSQYIGLKGGPRPAPDNRGVIWATNPDYEKWSTFVVSPAPPGDLRLMAGPADAPGPHENREVSASIRVAKWSEKTGNDLHAEEKGLFRGSVPESIKVSSQHVDTGTLVVDIAGGDLVSPPRDKETRRPETIIVLNAEGGLEILDELGTLKEWTAVLKESQKPRHEGRHSGPGAGSPLPGRPGAGQGPDPLHGGASSGQGPPPDTSTLPDDFQRPARRGH